MTVLIEKPRIRWTMNLWQSILFATLTVGTGVLYFWNLTANGWANSFYSAAAQAGSKSWEAFFYGSLDSSNAITVDKTPMSLWFMSLSIRLFGLSSLSILLPEVLMGIASVVILFFIIRKRFGFWSGWVAGLTLALTPVAALMFRFNNPDALLALLMVLAIAATLKLHETEHGRWAWLVGMFIGFGFLTKMLQALLILPALAIVYMIFGRPKLGKRFLHLLFAFLGLVISAGWWIAIVELVPTSLRPYIGGSQTNSILELTLGYNGFGRLDGSETGSVVNGGQQGSAGQWGTPSIWRLFTNDIGGQIAWLLPLALIAMLGGFILYWRGRKADSRFFTTAALGASLLVTGLTFSLMEGIFHQYYTVALAPYIAGLVGVFVNLLITRRKNIFVRMIGAATVFGSGIWSYILLDRNSDLGWLKWVVITLAFIGAICLLFATGRKRWLSWLTAVITTVTLLVGPAYYTVYTVATAHSGSIVTAGPSVSSGDTRGGFGGTGATRGNFNRTGNFGGFGGTGATRGNFNRTGNFGGFTGRGATAPTGPGAIPGETTGTTIRGGFGGTGGGGLLNASTPSAAVQKLLEADASKYKWVAAAIGSQNAAGYQLATNLPVMAMGGFNGTDPYPSLSAFKKLVAAQEIHYYIVSGGVGRGSNSDTSSITTWVEANFKTVTVGGVTLYDLTSSK